MAILHRKQGLLCDKVNIHVLSGLLFRSNQECEDGWKYFVDSFGSRMCFRVTPTASSWQKAQEHCGRDIAHLLNLDPISRFTNVDRFTEREESLTDYLFQGKCKI